MPCFYSMLYLPTAPLTFVSWWKYQNLTANIISSRFVSSMCEVHFKSTSIRQECLSPWKFHGSVCWSCMLSFKEQITSLFMPVYLLHCAWITQHSLCTKWNFYLNSNIKTIIWVKSKEGKCSHSNDWISLLISSFLPSRKNKPMTSHTLINTTFARSNLRWCLFIFRRSHWYRQVMRELSTIWLYTDAMIRLTEITCSITRI